ncbi:Hypothetical predicted protein [Mytilus galloprovincialis]|uniref:Ig-like domain-containing protein n=1 Tax=Mytilus galloprovincialis TaxID=29158 RepID=A0A8B6EU48_MYTGA|nr:Hypothetical predicted protein [Mytilus galloprovincialis]
MDVVIYQSLAIFIFVLFYGVTTNSVVIEGSKGGLLGENGTEINCSYTIPEILFVSFLAFNRSSEIFEIIATYRPDRTPQLNTQGQYLNGRVTLTPITQSSKKAVMTFNQLMCIDDTSYKCEVSYLTDGGNKIPESNNITISVQVPPSKPDDVLLVHTPAVSSVITTNMMDYSSSSPSTAVTLKENKTVSASSTDKQNTTTAMKTTGHDTTTSTPYPDDDVSPNVSYTATTYSIQQTTAEQVIAEGDNITVVCTGDVGRPPAEHIFQKYLSDHTLSMTYTPTETSISEIPENCSFYRTSNITFQVTAADNNAVIRCVVISSMTDLDMYVETKPIEVHYEVSEPTITKYPNEPYYVVGENTSILLTCNSDGNPKPNYQWYKDNMLINTNENLTITDMNITNSGIYICNVTNTFNGDTHRNAKDVHINIMNKDIRQIIEVLGNPLVYVTTVKTDEKFTSSALSFSAFITSGNP